MSEDAKSLRRPFALRSIEVSPETYSRLANLALVMLTLIVFTGAAVRLSGSGLGCPDWPKCYGGVAPPLETHAVIEYGNRILSGFVGLAAIAAGAAAWFRVPRRRDLIWLGAIPAVGVICQAILGGFTVRYHLAPGFVMGHFGLSMLILIGTFALAWRAHPTWASATRAATTVGRRLATGLWAVGIVGAITILAGTAATAAGPHAGGAGTDDVIDRLNWFGADTLDWAIHWHGRIATVFGLGALAALVIAWRRAAGAALLRPLAILVALLGIQGAIGFIQYELELPSEIVWFHVALATLTWLAVLWVLAVTGRPSTRTDL